MTITDSDLTIMLAMHDAFRRDLGYLATAGAAFRAADPGRRAALVTGWELFTYQLRQHAALEDHSLWPRARDRLATSSYAVEVLALMEAQHAELDPALAAVDIAIAYADVHSAAVHGRLTDAADALTGLLRTHLADEERHALPLLKQTITRREWLAVGRESRRELGLRGATRYFPWLLDGADAARTADVLALLPAPLRSAHRRRWNPAFHRTRRWL